MRFVVSLAFEQKLTHGKATLTTWGKKKRERKKEKKTSGILH